MSKSWGRYVTVGYVGGSNTDYYRRRNRRVRAKNNQRLRYIKANKNITEFDDYYIGYYEPDNSRWMEPTDGTYKLMPHEIVLGNWNYTLYKVKNKNRVKK